jgi:hypothetical protein
MATVNAFLQLHVVVCQQKTSHILGFIGTPGPTPKSFEGKNLKSCKQDY